MGVGTVEIGAGSISERHHVRGPVGCGLRWGLGMGGGATFVKTCPTPSRNRVSVGRQDWTQQL